MGWKFNPFTGALDQTGSGGGGSSYIDGEVATYNDLSLDAGVAALNTAWLVRGSSGVWPFTKPGGVYIRTATGGSSRDADYTYAGVFPDVFSDANFTLYDDGDSTKNAKFQLSGISTGTTRTLTVPDASGTITLDGHTHSATDITSGTLANARINWAAPSGIGSTTAAAGAFTTLSASGIVTAANSAAAPPTTTSDAKGIQFTSLGGGTNQVAAYGSYAGTPTFGIAAGTGAGSLTEIAAFNLNGIGFNRALTVGNGTLMSSTSVLDVAPTWNNSGVTFNAFRVNVTNTASGYNSEVARLGVVGQLGPLFLVTGNPRAVIILSNYNFSDSQFTCNHNTIINNNAQLGFTGDFSGISDLVIRRDAADTLAQRRTTNPQTFRLYNTYTDASNYERGFMRWSSNVLQVGTEKLGTGSARALEFRTDNTARLTIGSAGTVTLNTTLAADAQNISTDTTTGTKIGTGTTQKLGFFNATPVAQQAAVADATDAASTQARLNDLLARLRTLGLIAT